MSESRPETAGDDARALEVSSGIEMRRMGIGRQGWSRKECRRARTTRFATIMLYVTV